MDSNFLKKLKPIIERLAEKHGLSSDQGTDILSRYFQFLKTSMLDPRIPTVKTPIGNFLQTPTQSNLTIKYLRDHPKAKNTPQEYKDMKIQFIQEVVERIKQEKNGELTFQKWNLKSKKVDRERKLKDIEEYERQREINRKKKRKEVLRNNDNSKE